MSVFVLKSLEGEDPDTGLETYSRQYYELKGHDLEQLAKELADVMTSLGLKVEIKPGYHHGLEATGSFGDLKRLRKSAGFKAAMQQPKRSGTPRMASAAAIS